MTAQPGPAPRLVGRLPAFLLAGLTMLVVIAAGVSAGLISGPLGAALPSSTSSIARPTASPGGLSPSPSPLPSGGISEAHAIELARSHTSMTTFSSATAGAYRDLAPPGTGFDDPTAADRLVWAVEFTGDITICNPLGVCYSPRPGTNTVYLDYSTGAFVSSAGFAPNPSP